MPLSNKALDVVTRPLPKDKIKQRPGKGGMTFNYISADLVIELLNEAFDHLWSTTIVSHEVVDGTAIVGLELSAYGESGIPVHKQQFGSCEINRGMGPGEAFKGAASDALKKAATLLGIGLELYQDDAPSSSPRLPQAKSGSTSAAPKSPVSPPRSPSAPKGGNPFSNGAPTTAANVPAPKPVAVPRGTLTTPPTPPTPAAPRANPFASASASGSGPNSTQMNAMTNLASRKNLSQPDMIALADITDGQGSPVQTFDELTHPQAIEVIKAAQL